MRGRWNEDECDLQGGPTDDGGAHTHIVHKVLCANCVNQRPVTFCNSLFGWVVQPWSNHAFLHAYRETGTLFVILSMGATPAAKSSANSSHPKHLPSFPAFPSLWLCDLPPCAPRGYGRCWSDGSFLYALLTTGIVSSLPDCPLRTTFKATDHVNHKFISLPKLHYPWSAWRHAQFFIFCLLWQYYPTCRIWIDFMGFDINGLHSMYF